MTKKYASLSTLQTFLNNLKNLFATKTTVDELSTNVAYINAEDNENITDVETENTGGSGGGGNANIDVTATVGQTIVVKEVDANGKPTKWESADYQPRTHWMKKTVILPESTYEIDPEIGGATLPELALEEGKEYAVNYNGTEYVSVCGVFSGAGNLIIGNIPLALETGDNGQPFVIIFEGEWFLAPVVVDGATSVTLSISEIKPVTIPPKYLPEGIGYEEWKVVLPETTITASITNPAEYSAQIPTYAYKVGETYRVTYNGTVYECVAVKTYVDVLQGECVALVNKGFSIIYADETYGCHLIIYSSTIIDTENNSTVTVTLKIEAIEPVKIPHKYLPEGIGYDEKQSLFEGTVEYDEENGFMFIPNSPLFVGTTYTINYNGTTYTCTAVDSAEVLGDAGGVLLGNYALAEGMGDTGEPFVMVYVDGAVIIETVEEITSVTLSISGTVPTKIPDKYLDLSNAFPYYLTAISGSGTDADPFRFNETASILDAVYNSGRHLILRFTTPSAATGILEDTYYVPLAQVMLSEQGFLGYDFRGEGVHYSLPLRYRVVPSDESGTLAGFDPAD